MKFGATLFAAAFAGLSLADYGEFGPGKLKVDSNNTQIDGSFVDIKNQGPVPYAVLLSKDENKDPIKTNGLPVFQVVSGNLVVREPAEPKTYGAVGQHNVSGIPSLSFVINEVPRENLFNHANDSYLTAMGIQNFYACNANSEQIIAFYPYKQSPSSSLDCTPVRLHLDQGQQ